MTVTLSTRDDQQPRAAWHLRLQAICLGLGVLVSLMLVVTTTWAPDHVWIYIASIALASLVLFQSSRMFQEHRDFGWWLAVGVEAALVACSLGLAVGSSAVARLNGAVWPCLVLFFLVTDDRRTRRGAAE